MKKTIIFLIYNFLVFSYGNSQDYLVKKNLDSIKVKIIEVGLKEVKYKEFQNLSGITYGIYKSEVLRIRYENGRVETFTDEEIAKSMSPEEKCRCGRSDAAKYHGMKGAGFACGAYCGPFAMLGTAITRQSPRTGARTLRMSDNQNLFNDPHYLKCYNKRAKTDLLNMELQGFVAAIVVPIVFVLMFL